MEEERKNRLVILPAQHLNHVNSLSIIRASARTEWYGLFSVVLKHGKRFYLDSRIKNRTLETCFLILMGQGKQPRAVLQGNLYPEMWNSPRNIKSNSYSCLRPKLRKGRLVNHFILQLTHFWLLKCDSSLGSWNIFFCDFFSIEYMVTYFTFTFDRELGWIKPPPSK